jgi:hypothetical protein
MKKKRKVASWIGEIMSLLPEKEEEPKKKIICSTKIEKKIEEKQ